MGADGSGGCLPAGSAPLTREFFDRPGHEVAPDLLGRVIAHGPVAVRLTEVEAYGTPGADPASHTYRGRTPRNAVMFGPPGHLYVYFTYGMHFCANIVCLPEGVGSGVLLRAGEVVSGAEVALARRTGAPAVPSPPVTSHAGPRVWPWHSVSPGSTTGRTSGRPVPSASWKAIRPAPRRSGRGRAPGSHRDRRPPGASGSTATPRSRRTGHMFRAVGEQLSVAGPHWSSGARKGLRVARWCCDRAGCTGVTNVPSSIGKQGS